MKSPITTQRISPLLRALLLAIGFAALTTTSHAATYYLQATTGNTDWTSNTSVWWNQTTGGGSHPSAISGNDFDVNGFFITATNGTNTFPGNSLTLDGGGGVRIRGNTTISNTLSTGGKLYAQDVSGLTYTLTNFNAISGTTSLEEDNGGTANLTVNIGTITGAGNLAATTTSAFNETVVLSLTSGSGWTGNLNVGNGGSPLTLQLGSNLSWDGGLIATNASSRISLGSDTITVSSLTLNGTSLGAGTYSDSYLNTNYGSIFTSATDSGSITVEAMLAPEPSSFALMLCGCGALFVFLRGKRKANQLVS
jgi:hypothetical protein